VALAAPRYAEPSDRADAKVKVFDMNTRLIIIIIMTSGPFDFRTGTWQARHLYVVPYYLYPDDCSDMTVRCFN